ncbi:MAG: hypothetical protein R3B47_14620 [Bacteroidia bacterium]
MDPVIEALSSLGAELGRIPATVIERACKINPWFSPFYIQQAASGISEWLHKDNLFAFVQHYEAPVSVRRLGLITAGNLPFVGFHDILTGIFERL